MLTTPLAARGQRYLLKLDPEKTPTMWPTKLHIWQEPRH